MRNLSYKNLKLQPYLKSQNITKENAQITYKLRTRMADFKSNFKNGNDDLLCKMCKIYDSSKKHILECP